MNTAAADHVSVQMAQRMFHESGQDGRSVLGMVAVQVERDPKTGASIVRSVAPVSEPAGATPMATAVFDDGRKSIHAFGGSGSQPSSEELGQILSIVDGVGMKVLLDEVTVTPNEPEIKIENVDAAPQEKVLSFSTHYDVSKEDDAPLESSKSYDSEAELEEEDCAVNLGNEEDQKEDRVEVRDIAGEVENVEDLKLEEGPVTLVFLGYADADQAQSQEDRDSSMITVERVMITEDGEEHVIGPETSASETSASETSAATQAEKEAKVFQEVPLDGNGVKVQGEEGDKGLHNSSPPAAAEGGGTTKRKTCQCCSVM